MPVKLTEEEKVIQWRLHELKNAGYPPHLAREIAIRTDIILHLAIELLEDGCDPKLAWRILR